MLIRDIWKQREIWNGNYLQNRGNWRGFLEDAYQEEEKDIKSINK